MRRVCLENVSSLFYMWWCVVFYCLSFGGYVGHQDHYVVVRLVFLS